MKKLTTIEEYQNFLAELYQVLGALDAPEKILDQVSAAMQGEELPHESLLPFHVEAPEEALYNLDVIQLAFDATPDAEGFGKQFVEAFKETLKNNNLVVVPRVPVGAQWNGLARDIMMAWDMNQRKPEEMFKHLNRANENGVPEWMKNEAEMGNPDHLPSKGTRAVLIYRAMVEDFIAHSNNIIRNPQGGILGG